MKGSADALPEPCVLWLWVPVKPGTTAVGLRAQRDYIGLYVRTSAGTLTPSLIWPTDLMMSSPSSCAKQA
jgi:hypothetical protein